jgi:hypothetical protein
MRAVLATVGVVVALVAVSPLAAQPPEGEAQRLSDQARAEVEAGRLPAARDLLQRSLALQPSTTTAFNLGLVLHDLGQLVAARDLLERVLAGEYGTLAADRVARTQEMLRTLAPRIGTLLCTVRGAPETAVWVDGVRAGVALDGAALRVPVDPGEHRLRFVATGRRPIEQRVRVDPGVVVPLAIAFPREPTAETVGPTTTPVLRRPQGSTQQSATGGILSAEEPREDRRDRDDGDGGSIFASPWLWIAVAVVAAGATVSILLLGGESEDTSVPPGFVGRVETLR